MSHSRVGQATPRGASHTAGEGGGGTSCTGGRRATTKVGWATPREDEPQRAGTSHTEGGRVTHTEQTSHTAHYACPGRLPTFQCALARVAGRIRPLLRRVDRGGSVPPLPGSIPAWTGPTEHLALWGPSDSGIHAGGGPAVDGWRFQRAWRVADSGMLLLGGGALDARKRCCKPGGGHRTSG
jgi:hypothetical protein